MFKLDNAFLEELGLGVLPPVEKNKMLAHIYETLEMRVGMKLAEKMSNEQLDEFESYINKQDEAGALKWLESNFPDYKKVVAEELEKLKAEISQVAPQIVSQAQENAAAAAQQPQVNAPTQPQQPVQTQNQPQSQPQQTNNPMPQQPVQAPAPISPPQQPINNPVQPQPQQPSVNQDPTPPPMPQQPWTPDQN